jgi:hypothetical protein
MEKKITQAELLTGQYVIKKYSDDAKNARLQEQLLDLGVTWENPDANNRILDLYEYYKYIVITDGVMDLSNKHKNASTPLTIEQLPSVKDKNIPEMIADIKRAENGPFELGLGHFAEWRLKLTLEKITDAFNALSQHVKKQEEINAQQQETIGQLLDRVEQLEEALKPTKLSKPVRGLME